MKTALAIVGGALAFQASTRCARDGSARPSFGTVALNVAMLEIVLLPAAAEAYRRRVPAPSAPRLTSR